MTCCSLVLRRTGPKTADVLPEDPISHWFCRRSGRTGKFGSLAFFDKELTLWTARMAEGRLLECNRHPSNLERNLRRGCSGTPMTMTGSLDLTDSMTTSAEDPATGVSGSDDRGTALEALASEASDLVEVSLPRVSGIIETGRLICTLEVSRNMSRRDGVCYDALFGLLELVQTFPRIINHRNRCPILPA